MRYQLLLIPFCVLLSCNNRPDNSGPVPETPKALQENSSEGIDLRSSKKSYESDLVQSLYEELADKTPELKDLDKRLDHLYEARVDSVEAFNSFDQKNNSYFGSAGTHADRITDSLLRDRMRSIIAASQSKYNAQIERHTGLIKLLESRSTQLGDLFIVLKLVKTLAIMEKYQKENIPASKPIEQVIREYNKTIQRVDSLTKK